MSSVRFTIPGHREPTDKRQSTDRLSTELRQLRLHLANNTGQGGIVIEGSFHFAAGMQDGTVVAATEVESSDRARTMERTFSNMIVLGRIVKRGKDEEVYYNHTQVSSNEKEVSVKFSMPRAEMSALLSKYSEEKK